MDTNGKINDLGRQYIGANTTYGYTSGVTSGGNGGRAGKSGGIGGLSRPLVGSTLLAIFAAALFVVLLI